MLSEVHSFIISKDQLAAVLRGKRRLHRVGRSVDLRMSRDGAELLIEFEIHRARDPLGLGLTAEQLQEARAKAPRSCPKCGWVLQPQEPDGPCGKCSASS